MELAPCGLNAGSLGQGPELKDCPKERAAPSFRQAPASPGLGAQGVRAGAP